MAETFEWVKPAPLWEPAGADLRRGGDFLRPLLLEFGTDTFMEDFLAAAAAPAPDALRGRVLPIPPGVTPKLFQALHGRYYLVCASLCCRRPGFPDREIARGDGERVCFVLRKVSAGVEYGWVSHGATRAWSPAAAGRVLRHEEPLPLFPAASGARTIYGGYVPVASRETYAAAPALSPVAFGSPRAETDARIEFLRLRVLQALTSTTYTSADPAMRRDISVYALLDLWEFFLAHLPALAAALKDGTPVTGAEERVLEYMRGLEINRTVTPHITLAGAVGRVARHRDALNDPAAGSLPPEVTGLAVRVDFSFDDLAARIRAALPPGPPPPVEVGKFVSQPGDHFLVRCVYRRPQCDPAQDWVSAASPLFDLAPVFDPDAPARPIRIGLPDTSIRSLRKFAKGVAFSFNEELQKQMRKPDVNIGGIQPTVHAVDAGFICSLSIPIVTICAFILLMIVVNILNVVFRWLPYFQICFPLKPSVKT